MRLSTKFEEVRHFHLTISVDPFIWLIILELELRTCEVCIKTNKIIILMLILEINSPRVSVVFPQTGLQIRMFWSFTDPLSLTGRIQLQSVTQNQKSYYNQTLAFSTCFYLDAFLNSAVVSIKHYVRLSVFSSAVFGQFFLCIVGPGKVFFLRVLTLRIHFPTLKENLKKRTNRKEENDQSIKFFRYNQNKIKNITKLPSLFWSNSTLNKDKLSINSTRDRKKEEIRGQCNNKE